MGDLTRFLLVMLGCLLVAGVCVYAAPKLQGFNICQWLNTCALLNAAGPFQR